MFMIMANSCNKNHPVSEVSQQKNVPTKVYIFRKSFIFFSRTSTPEHFGTGIYLVASLLNHSCSPKQESNIAEIQIVISCNPQLYRGLPGQETLHSGDQRYPARQVGLWPPAPPPPSPCLSRIEFESLLQVLSPRLPSSPTSTAWTTRRPVGTN